jgi:serine/threonine protein kinase
MPRTEDVSLTQVKHATPPDDTGRGGSGGTGAEAVALPGTFGPPAEPDEIGTLGPYRVLRKLGAGAMGVVYHARHDFLYGDVALKVMGPSEAQNPSSKERFLREARAAFKLRHPHVVEVFDAAEINGVPYIAMQLLAGCSLDERLRRGPELTVREALRVTREAALGLAAAHALGLIHRDVKPANLWIEEPGGRAKVLDFGLVKQLGTDRTLTAAGEAVGTPRFMSPEQARGQKVDHRSDLFSLGSLLYRLCTGRFAFDGDHAYAVVIAIGTETPVPARRANPDVPPAVADLIHALLEKDPAARVGSAHEVVARIAAAEAELDRAPTVTPVPARARPPEPPPAEEPDSDIDELLALKADPGAAAGLAARAVSVWRVAREHLHRADVRIAFRELIAAPDRVRELWDAAVGALLNGEPARWDVLWATVCEFAPTEDARKLLRTLVGSKKNEERLMALPADARARLRAACGAVQLFPPRPLLVPNGPDELAALLAEPPDRAGHTAFVALAPDRLGWLAHLPAAARAEHRARARGFLLSAPVAAACAYVRAAREHLDAGPEPLDVLFRPYSPAGARLLSELLAVGALEPRDWRALCDSADLTRGAWGEALLEGDRLAALLAALADTGREVWARYLAALGPALLAPDPHAPDGADEHARARLLHAHLRGAAGRLAEAGLALARALPDGGAERLAAADALDAWVRDPAAAERAGSAAVRRACDHFGTAPLDLVRAALRADAARGEHPDPLFPLFRTLFPVGSARAARAAVAHWIKLSRDVPPAARAEFQLAFVFRCVRPALFCELLDEPFEPFAAERVFGAVEGRVNPADPRAARPRSGRGWWLRAAALVGALVAAGAGAALALK